MENAPEKYQILPAPIEKVINVAQAVGRFLRPQTSVVYLSEHYTPGPTDGEAMEPEFYQPVIEGWDDMGTYIDETRY